MTKEKKFKIGRLMIPIFVILLLAFGVTQVTAFTSYSTDFEDFDLGHRTPQVNGLPLIDDPSTTYEWRGDGLTGLGGQEDYDADIVDTGGVHGKVFRTSNPDSAATGNYDTTHPATPQTDLAGETATGATYGKFSFSYDFKAAVSTMQTGLEVRTTAIEAGTASRQALLTFTDDSTDGFSVGYWDYYSGGFRFTTLATGLSRTVWHSLSVEMCFYEGVDNDIVTITLDGSSYELTSWEAYYKAAGPPQPEYAGVNSVIFRLPTGGGPEGDGVYFDNFACEVGSLAYPVVNTDTTEGFSTIQAAIDDDDTLNGHTIEVSDGIYPENIVIDKQLTLQAGSNPIIDGSGGVCVVISSSDVTIDGFEIRNGSQGILGWLGSPINGDGYQNIKILNNHIHKMSNGVHGFGIYLGTESERYNPSDPLGIYDSSLTSLMDFTGLEITGNEINDTSGACVTVQSMYSTGTALLIENNYIHDGTQSAIWVDSVEDFDILENILENCVTGIFLSAYSDGYYEGTPNAQYDPKNINIINNDLTNNGNGVSVHDGWPSLILINENNIVGNTGNGVYNYLSENVTATCNWWGDVGGPTHSSNPSGTGDGCTDFVLYTPWLDDAYPDGDCAGGTCFDPIWVDDDQTAGWYDEDHVASIQTAIDRLCPNGTIYVAAGTYNQSFIIKKPLKLFGAGASQTIINGSSVTGGTKVKIEAYGDLTIDGFTIDASESNSWTTVIGFDAVALPDDNPGLWTFTNNIFELGTIYFDHTDADINISNNVFHTPWEAVGTEECRGAIEIGFNEMTFDNVYSWNCPGLLKFTNYPKYWENSSGPFLIPNNVTTKQWIHNNTMNCDGGIGIVFNSYTEAENWDTWGGPQYIDSAAVFSNIVIENNEITDVGDFNYDGAWGPPVYPNVGILLQRYGNGTGFENTIISNNIINPDTSATEDNQGIVLSGNCSDTTIVQNTITNFTTAIYLNSTTDEYPTETNAHYNNFEGNDYALLTECPIYITNATCNWWGDVSGPSGQGSGSGDAVSSNVLYCPWLDDAYPAGDCTGGAVCWNTDTGEYFCSIQAAIDDADTNDNPGDHDTIEVFAVTDIEQVNVYKSVTIYGQGTGNTIIQSPDSLTDYFATSNNNYPIIYVNNVDDVIIHNLTVDGAGKGNSNYRFVGVGLYQAGAILKDLEVINIRDTPFSGAQHGNAIFAWSDTSGLSHSIQVKDCNVYDYQKNGITLSGSELSVLVEDCTVTGAGPTPVTAQNGIQVSHGATGVITENTVTGCSYTGGYWAASGILPQLSSGVLEITDNTITDNQANIYLVACSALIDGNTIQASSTGVGLSNYYGIIGDPGDPPVIPDAQPMDPGSPPTNRETYEITVTNNMISGDGVSDSSVGVGVYAGLLGDYDIEFTALNNHVLDWYLGFELYEYAPAGLISAEINYNNIVGNTYGIYNWLTTTYDCTCNWYGDALGPTHPDNPAGSGDVVSDYVDYVPWLNLPFDDPLSECGAGLCQDTVYVDDDFTSSTPGWYVDHFPTIQIALERLSSYGTAIIYDGIYDEDVLIDDDHCDNTGITIKGVYECFPTDEAAVIKGNMLISVSDVLIQYLEFTPTVDAAITVDDGVSGTVLECNKFRRDCVADAVGVQVLGGSVVDAELNWWGAPDGPSGGLMGDGKLADGFGVQVVGDVMVEPWVGVHAEISEPVGTVEIEVGDAVGFDALGSFAFSFGGCCEETLLHMQYEWDFQDGSYSHNKMATHVFNSPGSYEVSLMVDAPGIAGLFGNFMYDWDYVTVHVVEPDTPLTVSADGENLGGYETRVGEPVQLFGDAFGGEGEYYWSWSFGDQTGGSSERNPVHVYDSPGAYMVELTVTSGGETASDTVEVMVFDVDELLVDLVDGSGVADVEMLFAASVSGGSEPYSYVWDFGDGFISSEKLPAHTYAASGEYTVTVMVTDDAGRSVSDTAVVIVEEDSSGVELVEITGVSGGLFLSVDISAGDEPVIWSIGVDGGLVLFGGSSNGELPAQVTETVKLPLTLGFGKVSITVTANQISRSYEGFLLGPFFIGLE